MLISLIIPTGCSTSNKEAAKKGADYRIKSVWVDLGVEKNVSQKPLIIHLPRLPRHLNPLLSNATSACLMVAKDTIYQPLFRRVNDDQFIPLLAKSAVWEKQGRRLLVEIRDGVRFHDGRKMSVNDVFFSMRSVLKKNSINRWLKEELDSVLNIAVIKPSTIAINLKRVDYRLPLLLTDLLILPAHRFRKGKAFSHRYDKQPIGTGPFVFVNMTSEGLIKLKRNEDYWKDLPSIREIVFKEVRDPAQVLVDLRNENLDIVPSLYPGYYPKDVKTPRFTARYSLNRQHPHRQRVLLFNLRQPVLRSKDVRSAIIRAIDRQKLLRTQRGELGKLSSAPIYSLSPYFDRSLHPRSYDEKGAAASLKRKLKHLRGSKKQTRLSLLFVKSETTKAMAKAIVKDLRAVGIAIDLKPAGFSYFKQVLGRGQFDLVLMTIALAHFHELTAFLHSKGRKNYGLYSNSNFDALSLSMRTMPMTTDRVALGRRIHRILFYDAPMVVLFEPIELMVVSRRVSGLKNNGQWPLLEELEVN